jgi:hypothetical protein
MKIKIIQYLFLHFSLLNQKYVGFLNNNLAKNDLAIRLITAENNDDLNNKMRQKTWDLAPFNIIFVKNSNEFGVAPEELKKNTVVECLEAIEKLMPKRFKVGVHVGPVDNYESKNFTFGKIVEFFTKRVDGQVLNVCSS